MVARPEVNAQIEEMVGELSDAALADVFLGLVQRQERDFRQVLAHITDHWQADESELLEMATVVASRHETWHGEDSRLRSLLMLPGVGRDFTSLLAGGPRQVVETLERSTMVQARLKGEAIRSIWSETMLRSSDAARALGVKPTNREKVRRYRARSTLLGLPSGNGFLYPAFQFEHDRRAVFEEVAAVNVLLNAAEDPWGVASWWFGEHDRLSCRPIELVGSERATDLVAVAGAVSEPVG